MREAFFVRGCHTQYYRKRCIVCEQPMERKRESQQLCKGRKCKSQFAALKAHFLLGRYHSCARRIKKPNKTGHFFVPQDRPILAPGGGSGGGRASLCDPADDALNQADRANRRHWVKAGSGALIQKRHTPINVIGGFKFANAPVIDLGTVPTASSDPTPLPASTEGDGLDIPDFLART
jgi:hypothetical protein